MTSATPLLLLLLLRASSRAQPPPPPPPAVDRYGRGELTPGEFERSYRHRRPVLFALGPPPLGPAGWRAAELAARFGGARVPLGTHASLARDGGARGSRAAALADYLAGSAAGYLFEIGPERCAPGPPPGKGCALSVPGVAAAVAAYMAEGGALAPFLGGGGAAWRPVLSVASPGAGSHGGIPLHRHHESWLYLLHGRKRWGVLPPDAPASEANTSLGAEEWFATRVPRLAVAARPAEVEQRAGTVMYGGRETGPFPLRFCRPQRRARLCTQCRKGGGTPSRTSPRRRAPIWSTVRSPAVTGKRVPRTRPRSLSARKLPRRWRVAASPWRRR